MRATMITALGLAMAFAAVAPAPAMPVPPLDNKDPALIQVFGGCGPYGHRGPYNGCRPGGQLGGYGFGRACPPGWHLGPYGRRCWRNW